MRLFFLSLVICFIVLWQFGISSCNNKEPETGDVVKNYFNLQTDSLIQQLTLLDSFVKHRLPINELQQQFIICRYTYKRTEPFIEYFFQGLSKRINGPALPDIKTDDNQVWPPHGFQVLEQFLYSAYDTVSAPQLSNEIKLLQADLKFAKTNLEANTISAKYFAACIQQQFIRIATLGITGFDAPLSKLSLPESVAALTGIEAILQLKSITLKENLFASAIGYLKKNNDFDNFNRMEFLQLHLIPLSDAVYSLQKNDLESDSIPQPFKGPLSSLLKGRSFNADYFTAYAASFSNSYKVELGKKLFFDKQLSKSGNTSCGSCHKPEMYFTDGLAKANDFVHGGKLARNTPSVYYAALQNNQFYDMRSNYLEDQVNEVMKNSNEFNFTALDIANRIAKDTVYKNLFAKAFTIKDSIGGLEVRNALAAFIRSLNPFSSRFDEYMNGIDTALTNDEIRGFNLFTGKAKCATCHFMPVFNGTAPPWYNKTESEIIGVPAAPVWKNAAIDKDSGRYAFNQLEQLRFAFKTPTIRNAAKTAPYMHNGVYKTLDEVVEFYHVGGGVGIGINMPFQSLPFDSLILNPAEKKAIVSFIGSLTDKEIKY
jgi:cytochrome c peroxidase